MNGARHMLAAVFCFAALVLPAFAGPLYQTFDDALAQGTYSGDTYDSQGFPVTLYWPDQGLLVYRDCAYQGSDLRCGTYDTEGNYLGDTLITNYDVTSRQSESDALHPGTDRISSWWGRSAARMTSDLLRDRVRAALSGPAPAAQPERAEEGAERRVKTPPAPPRTGETSDAASPEPFSQEDMYGPSSSQPVLEQPLETGKTSLPAESMEERNQNAPPAPKGPAGGPGRIHIEPLVFAQGGASPGRPAVGGPGRISIEPLQFVDNQAMAPAPANALLAASSDAAAPAQRITIAALQVRDAPAASAPVTGMAAGNTPSRLHLWTDGMLSSIDNDTKESAFSGNLFTGLVGADYRINDRLAAGLALGYEYADFDTQYNDGSLSARGLTVAPYAGALLLPELTVEASLGFTFLTGDQSRREAFGGVDADFEAFRTMGALDVTYQTAVFESVTLEGSLGYLYVSQNTDSFTESDGTKASSHSDEVGQMRVMVRGSYAMQRMEPYVKLAYLYDAQFSANDADRDEAWAAAGLTYQTGNALQFDLEGSGSFFREDYSEYRLRAGFRFAF